MRNFVQLFAFVAFLIGLSSCGGDSRFEKTPVDMMIKEMTNVPKFTIMLYDMDVEGTFAKTYKHQYRIIKEKDSLPVEEITGWYEVSEDFFQRHQNDMGMEIASKKDGKITKNVAPPGYSNYVGNQQYGQWVQKNGTSFWEFYGQYAFMSSMFNMFSYPVRRSYYDDYYGNYYRSGRPYYGPKTSGGHYYGTYSNYTQKSRPNSTWYSTKNQSFRDKVRNRVSRSSRSGSRYNGSGYRSRGGGFGK
jgi:hypothetical protein